MAIVIGMDEAGYGPLLGPLVVSGVVFRVPDDESDRCLWQTLRDSCTRRHTGTDRRLVVADSKTLFGRAASKGLAKRTRHDPGELVPASDDLVGSTYKALAHLALVEKAALVMLAVGGQRPATFREYLAVVAPQVHSCLDDYVWYADRDWPVPSAMEASIVGTAANAVRRNCAEQGIEFLGAYCEPVPEGHFNQLVSKTKNKADALVTVALRVLHRATSAPPDKRVRVLVDRLGGRTHYRDMLQLMLPGFACQILDEGATQSSYRFTRGEDLREFSFCVKGESHHLPIALASLFSKYTRELFMRAFNDYWAHQQAGLRPTAGYYSDAKRWIHDASPTLERLRVDKRLLIRER